MRLMCDTCICLDICLQIHSQAFLKVSGWIAFAAAECKRNLFSLRIILLKPSVKKKAIGMDIILKLKQWKIQIYFKINQIPMKHIIAIVKVYLWIKYQY